MDSERTFVHQFIGMRIGYFTLVFLNLMGIQIFGQSTEETDIEGHHHDQDAHTDHHRHEIGMAGSAVYLIREEVVGSSIHLHYTFNIPETRFGVGAGYEVILTEHHHLNHAINAFVKVGQELGMI
jgi:hypothetical protein